MMKKSYLLLFIIAFFFQGRAQDSLINRKSELLPFYVFKTSDQNLTIQQVIHLDSLFKPPVDYVESTRPNDIYWIKVDAHSINQTVRRDSLLYLSFRKFGYLSVYHKSNEKYIEKKIGFLEKQDTKRSILYNSGIPITKNTLIRDHFVYFKVRRIKYFDNVRNWKIGCRSNIKEQMVNSFYSVKDLRKLIPIYIFSGLCLVIFLFTLIFYLNTRRMEFLFYALYVIFLFLYLTQDIFRFQEDVSGERALLSKYTFLQVSQVFINLFYILFVKYYLNTKKDYPLLNKVLEFEVVFLIVVIVLDIIFLSSTFYIGDIYLLHAERLVMTIIGLCSMVYLWLIAKDKLPYFIIIGSFLYMIGALLLLFTKERLFMTTGSGLELLIFTVGLTYKIQNELKDKIKFQNESINNKIKALRAQINPHFIFNSLSSIQHLVTKNDKLLALKYLSKFSRLTRNILENSLETNTLLCEEITLLKDYLELESLRFENTFTYDISIDKKLDMHAIEMPSMILQPFVENAIIHGLLPKETGTKEIAIRFKENNDIIICEVEDNGIGRLKAGLKEHIHRSEKKSRGIEVTKQRLSNLGKITDPLKIVDKTDANGRGIGTKVVVKIPLNNVL